MLVNKKIVKETPEDVAHFLKTEAALKKKAIGDYIGEMYMHSIMYSFFPVLMFNAS
jgi:Sec7-like guanine-nucleotide exchange factor